jgi:hypothetical protein
VLSRGGGSVGAAIAAELVLGERAVDRHVTNIFKLGVWSRVGATAYAFERGCSERQWVRSPTPGAAKLGGSADARPRRHA